MKTPAPIVLAAALGLSLAAGTLRAADLVKIEWTADGRFDQALAVPAGRFAEVCGRLPGASRVDWRFEAGAALDFNVHYHEGKQVVFPARLAAVSRGQGRLEAVLAQDYCWMWVNKSGAEVVLTLGLQRRD